MLSTPLIKMASSFLREWFKIDTGFIVNFFEKKGSKIIKSPPFIHNINFFYCINKYLLFSHVPSHLDFRYIKKIIS